jgi:hypothetical protein
VFKLRRSLKLKENFQLMLNAQEIRPLEWLFYLSIVAFVAFVLLAVAFYPGFISGLFGALAIGSGYLAYCSLLEYQ